MQTQMICRVALLLTAQLTLAAALGGVRGARNLPPSVLLIPAPPSPAGPEFSVGSEAGSAPAPALPSLDVLKIGMEIKNLNYFDLTDDAGDLKEEVKEQKEEANEEAIEEAAGPIEDVEEDAQDAADVVEDTADNAADAIDEGAEDLVEDVADAVLPGGKSLLQKHVLARRSVQLLMGDATVQKKLRRAVEGAVKKTVCPPGLPATVSMGPAPAPAALPLPVGVSSIPPPVNVPPPAGIGGAPAAVLAQLPSPAPAPGPASMCAQPKVHVGFAPADCMKKKHKDHMINQPANGCPVSTKMTISVMDAPLNGANDMLMAEGTLKQAMASGVLQKALKHAMKKVLGFTPKIGNIEIKTTSVKAWDIPKCGSHMSEIVKSFTVHYTRRQVPMALENECTNFVTKIAFSNDHVLDPRDTAHCKKATENFARRWKLGKKDGAKDFEKMCVTFCEAKYGNDAPLCNVNTGDALLGQPL